MSDHSWLHKGIETVNVKQLADELYTWEAHVERVYSMRPDLTKLREGFLDLVDQKAKRNKDEVRLMMHRNDLNTNEYYVVIICYGQFCPNESVAA